MTPKKTTSQSRERNSNLSVVEGGYDQGSERRQSVRVHLATEQFKLEDAKKVFPIFDLSLEGMSLRLLDVKDGDLFQGQEALKGFINLDHQKHPVSVVLRHYQAQMIGLQFSSETAPESREAIARFLDPDEMGKSIRRIEEPNKNSQNLVRYRGRANVDLEFQMAGSKELSRFSIQLYNSYLSWDGQKGLETGHVRLDGNAEDHLDHLSSDHMVFIADSTVDSGKLAIAKSLILSSNILEDVKAKVLELLSTDV